MSHLDDIEMERIDQRTDHLGRVKYSGRPAGMADRKTYIIEIDAHIYFATLGIDCCQRKVVVFFRPVGPDDVYDIRSLIAPSMQSICCMRRPGSAGTLRAPDAGVRLMDQTMAHTSRDPELVWVAIEEAAREGRDAELAEIAIGLYAQLSEARSEISRLLTSLQSALRALSPA